MADYDPMSVPFTFFPQFKPIPITIWKAIIGDTDDLVHLPGAHFSGISWRRQYLDEKPYISPSGEDCGCYYMVPYVEEYPFYMTNVDQTRILPYDPSREAFETASRKAEEYLKDLLPQGKMQCDFPVKNGFVQVFIMTDDDGNFIFTEDHEGLPEGWDVYTCNAGIAIGRFPKNMDINRALRNRNRVHLLHWYEADITRVTDGAKIKLEVPPIPKLVPDAKGNIKKEDVIFRDIIYDYMAGNQFVILEPTKEVVEMAEYISSCFHGLSELMKPEESESAPVEDAEDQVTESATEESHEESEPSEPAYTGEQLAEAGIQVTEETISDMRSCADKEKEDTKKVLDGLLEIHCTNEQMENHFREAAARWGVTFEELPKVTKYLEKANLPPKATEGCYLKPEYYVVTVKALLMKAIALAGIRIEDFYRDPEDTLGPTDRGRFKDAVIYLMAGVNCASAEVSAVSYGLKKGTGNIDPESARRIRSKLKPEIFEFIFKEFTKGLMTAPGLKPLFCKMFGFLLYCVDGSDINLPQNKYDEETLCTNGKGRKPYNQIHLNAIYDCLNGFYVACNFRGTKKTGQGERKALYELLQEFTGEQKAQCLLICDRGYDGHETVTRLHKEKVNFLLRVKANNSNGFLSTFKSLKTLGRDTFYGELHYTISKNKKDSLPDGKTAHLVRKTFDFLEDGEVIHVHLRVLQFRLPSGELEALITNVPIWQLSPLQMYHVYSRRWGVESSFRSLKYQISVSQQHSWKKEYVRQELWAKLAMFNFVTFITSHTKVPETKRLKPRKYEYKIKTSRAVVLCRNLLVGLITVEEFGSQVVKRLQPIRPNRSYVRNVKPKSAVSFQHRGTGM